MKKGRICAVEFLRESDDEKRIAEGMELFGTKGLAMGAEGFEIWDQARFVYRFVRDETPGTLPAAEASKEQTGWLERLAQRLPLKRAVLMAPRLQTYALLG